MPTRRTVLAGLAVAAGPWGVAMAHTPYGQWVVYRQKHLLVGAHRGDAETYALAKKVVAALGAELPEAKARVARGPRPQRIASLMQTGQLMLAVLSRQEAQAMIEARPPFEDYRPTPLNALAGLSEDYLLVASPDLPADHAWLVTQALDHAELLATHHQGEIALHPGAAAFWAGEPLPG